MVLPKSEMTVRGALSARSGQAPATTAPPVDDYVFLLGRPPIAEFLGFVRTMAVDGPNADAGSLTEQWRNANDRLHELETAEAGIADNPPTLSLPVEIEALTGQVRASSMFREAYRYVPTEFAMVDLDRLVVFQKYINMNYVAAVRKSLPSEPTIEDMARLAFGIDRGGAPVQCMQNTQNAFTFISPSNDLRLLDAKLVQAASEDGVPTGGRAVARVLLTVGFGSNLLNAISVQDRLVLNNGTHRAYALRELGVRHAPCIIQRVTRREELELVAGGDLQQAPDRYLQAPRPALLKDYFDEALTTTIAVPRKNRIVRLQFGVEQSDVPATGH